jgi:hypothetical protein
VGRGTSARVKTTRWTREPVSEEALALAPETYRFAQGKAAGRVDARGLTMRTKRTRRSFPSRPLVKQTAKGPKLKGSLLDFYERSQQATHEPG